MQKPWGKDIPLDQSYSSEQLGDGHTLSDYNREIDTTRSMNQGIRNGPDTDTFRLALLALKFMLNIEGNTPMDSDGRHLWFASL